jgi:DNA-binding SARP family transcriptional activator/tetratricopeptide (TPR) repeat protein
VTVDLGLLGDIEVRIDGHPAEAGHSRQRAVLAALAVDAGRPVPVGDLIERVWGDDPPQRARGTLYGYLSRLRTVLGAGGAQVLRRPGGYLLTVDPQAVDMHRFGDLVDRARRAGTGEPAVDLYRRALALWRGDAFATLDSAWVNTWRQVLESQRLAARTDLYQIMLDRGHSAAVLADLTAAATAHPFDERLQGQLMLALHRCGRSSDAMDVFHRLRRVLADDLGAAPSRSLTELCGRIINDDPALTPSPPRTATVLPRQLPARPASFTGRSRDLAALDGAMATGQTVAITGLGGAGKTWLALKWSHDNLDRFPDGQLYVDLRGFDPVSEPLQPATVVRVLLDALGVDPSAVPAVPEAMTGLYRSLLADRRTLVVLDNARDSAQVVPLLPGHGRSAVIVTSRRELPGLVSGHGARSLRLGVLDGAESRALFAALAGPAAVAGRPDALASLVDRCGGLPLALGIMAARTTVRAGVSLDVLAGELMHDGTRLDALAAGDRCADLRSVLDCSYRALPGPVARVFRAVGSTPGPDVGPAAVASRAAVAVERVRPLLRDLVAAHLLDEPAPGRFSIHDLVRLYAVEVAARDEPPHGRDASTRRLLDHYVHTGAAAATLIAPFDDRPPPPPAAAGVTPERIADHERALLWFRAERPVLMAAVDHAEAAGFDGHVWQLAAVLVHFLSQNGHWEELAHAQRAAVRAARRMDDPTGEAYAWRNLALADIWLGDYPTADRRLRRALGLFDRLGHRCGQALAHRGLARVSARQGRFEPALRHARLALDLYGSAGHEHGIATMLNAVGWFLSKLGRHAEGLRHCTRALALAARIDDRINVANTHDSLGFVHGGLGDLDRARAHYRHAIDAFGRLGHPAQQAESLAALGDLLSAAGFDADARHMWCRSTDLLRRLGAPGATAPAAAR